MYIKDISLSCFRSYKGEKVFEFSDDVVGIIGQNAHGKTTILEAVYMLARGRGFREREEHELLTFGESHGHLIGTFIDDASIKHDRAIMFREVLGVDGDRKLEKKRYVEKAPVGQLAYLRNNPPVVLFAPNHIDIITHGPPYRREYLNTVISIKDLEFAHAIREYEAVIRRRNAILEYHESVNKLKEDIAHWDNLFLENAKIIQEKRAQYVEYLNSDSICAGKNFRIIYRANLTNRERLDDIFMKEASSRRTLAGPQKDDFEIQIEIDKNYFVSVHAYASRSQQRLAVLWLKIRELEYVATDKISPILLLDDIYSEFDGSNRKIITSIVPKYQTIITATDEIDIPHDVTRNMATIRV